MTYNDNFEELEKTYRSMIYSLINNKFIDNYTKEDLYQECLMVLDKCNNTFVNAKNVKFATFLYKSIQNRLFDLIRVDNALKRPNILYVAPDDTLLMSVLDTTDSVDDEKIELGEIYDKIISELIKLPRGNITLLMYTTDLGAKEIAQLENVSVKRIYFINKQNIKKVKKVLNI